MRSRDQNIFARELRQQLMPRRRSRSLVDVENRGDASVQAFIPPSTVRFAPVMYEDSGPATNATSAETSSTCPKRSSAVAAFCGTAHSVVAGFNSVSIGPGCTLLTVIPRLPSSLESDRVNIFTA